MKKSTLIIFLMLAIIKTQAQDYQISFAGAGDTTGVNTVKVENLTSGATVTLNIGDILHLIAPLGIESQKMNDGNLRIQPNPMIDQAVLKFTAPDKGNTGIGIYDLSGKTVCQIRVSVSQGENSFRISGINQGMYFVKITGKNYNYSIKLISQNITKPDARIEYVSSNKISRSYILKSTSTTIDMPYTTGDRLLYKGTSGQFSTIITDVPTSTKTITFNYALCRDNEGNNYTTVHIGTQVWMAENLKTTRYFDGSSIPWVSDSVAWSGLSTPGYCLYKNDTANQNTYGAIYNWFAVSTGKLAPAGWHVPSDAELTILTAYLGGESAAGGKLKETGTTHWRSPNAAATNESGFTALPTGHRDVNGSYSVMGDDGYWWSSTLYGSTGKAWYRNMNYNYDGVVKVSSNKVNGYSVRCIRDSTGFYIGQYYGGGIIFYIDSTGQHGLISALNDQDLGGPWGCDSTLIGTSIAIGTGQSNTTAIVNGCIEAGIAAKICDNLVLNGYNDWFLPSVAELYEMYLQRSVIEGFKGNYTINAYYWSSSEYDASYGRSMGFPWGNGFFPKHIALYVRAVRAF